MLVADDDVRIFECFNNKIAMEHANKRNILIMDEKGCKES